MGVLSYILIVAIVAWGVWFTYSKFGNIEKGTSERQKNIDEDMRVREKEKPDNNI